MDRLERIKGCFLAGACGDALGYPVEFDSGESIRAQYGAKGVREMTLSREGDAQITDDTQMTLFTAEGMLCSLKHHEDVTECIYHAYLDWMNTQGWASLRGKYHKESVLVPVRKMHARRAPGNTCLSVLFSGDMGMMEEPVNDSKGCGGVMRVAPCGMLNLMQDKGDDGYALQGAAASAITHGHLLGYVPGAMLADIISRILREESDSLEQIVLDSWEHVNRLFVKPVMSASRKANLQLFERLIRRAVDLAHTNVPAEEAIGQLGEGWVAEEALAIAVYCCLKYSDDMEACLSAAVTHKGDSDSTGAIAGNILGAWLGAGAIEEEHLAQLELRDVIEEMARRVAAAE